MRSAIAAAAAALLALAPCATRAADELESLYQQFHVAARARDAAAMARVSTAPRAREIAAGSRFELYLLSMTFPETYRFVSRKVSAGGNHVQLRAAGRNTGKNSKQPFFGIVDLLKVNGVWQVDRVGWANEDWPPEDVK